VKLQEARARPIAAVSGSGWSSDTVVRLMRVVCVLGPVASLMRVPPVGVLWVSVWTRPP
jgi:hypothetical protein